MQATFSTERIGGVLTSANILNIVLVLNHSFLYKRFLSYESLVV